MAIPVKPKPAVRPVPAARPVARPNPNPVVLPPQEEPQEETAIVETSPTALAVPAAWADRLGQYAAEIAEHTPMAGGSFISTRAGIITIDGQGFPEIDIIVLDHIFENTFYANAYDPDSPESPTCYAFGRTEAEMRPHPDCAEPQSDYCSNCPRNAWPKKGEVDDRGKPKKGKDCKNRRRLALISTNGLTPESVAETEVKYYKTPVTSAKSWDSYVHFLAASRLPPFAVETRFSTRPDPKNQYTCQFQAVAPLDEGILAAVMERYDSFKASDAIMFPYAKAATLTEEQAESPAEPVAPPAPRPAPAPRAPARPLPRPVPRKP